MIVLLGGTGYVGQAFANALTKRQWDFVAPTRKELNYLRFDVLLEYLQKHQPTFLINAAGYTGSPNVDACESARSETLAGNTLFPQTVAQACLAADIPWGHVSSGCIYSGAKVAIDGEVRIEKDLMRREVQALISTNPAAVQGYTESDAPNFTFRDPPCSFYSGTKALAEEAIAGLGRCYLWRLRIPFDEFDSPRNYLSKVQHYAKVYNNFNSLSHRGDFVWACLELWGRHAPFGIYNMTNPGFVNTREVVELIRHSLQLNRVFEFWANDAEFYRFGAKAPRSNCILDVSKLLATGIQLRSVQDALQDALQRWHPA